MRLVAHTLLVCVGFFFLVGSEPAVANTFWWNQTGNVSNDFNSSGNWNKTGGTTPVWGDQAFMTNAPSVNETNIAYLNTGNGGFDVLVISNRAGAAQGINMVLVNGTFLQGDFVRIGTNGMITVNNGSMTWWKGGTLGSGGTIVLNNSSLNYGGETEGNFQFAGTIVGNSGTVAGTASGGNDAFRILSGGRVIANSGTLYFNPNDAFDHDGLTIDAGAVLQVNSGATFVLNRTANAWNNDSPPDNAGTILLNGGTITMHFAGAQATDRGIQNSGTISGSGTLAMRVAQSSSGQTIASNGVLNLFQTIAGNQQTFTSDGGAFGTFKAVSGGTLKLNGNVASGMGGSWVVDNGGTLEVAGVNVDFGSAFMPGGNLNGTIKVTSGGNFTLSSATAGGPTVQQNGTFEFNAGVSSAAQIFMPNVAGLAAFTNAGTFILTGAATGVGTFTSGFGSGGNNYGLLNTGNILVGSGGTLVFNSGNAFAIGGFSNTASGVILITNSSDMVIRRDATAWNGVEPVVNAGQIRLGDGTLTTADGGGADATRMIRNVGTISTLANTTNTLRFSVQNAGTIAVTNTAAELRLAGTGTATANTSSGVIDVRDSSRLILTNLSAGTSLNFTNAGTIRLDNGTVLGGTITNTGVIVGQGTVEGGGVVNAGSVLASNLTANVGTLTVRLASFTNAANATIGTIGTQAVLNVRTPGAVNVLINNGTVNFSGGTITFNDGAAGTITNFNTIGGVGNLATFPVVNVGNASLIAQNPIPGLSNLIASVGVTNSGFLGARGGATLELTVGSGSEGLVNTNTVGLEGGFLLLNGGASLLTNVGGGRVYGSGVQNLNIVNLAGGSVIASNGVLTFGAANNANAGLFSNFNASSTIRLTNSILVNSGSVALNGGGLVLAGSTITNTGTITGPGDISSALYNDTTGFVAATNGVLNVATNAGEFVTNVGTFDIASGSTLNIAPSAWNNTNGTVRFGGGTLTGGSVTNKGTLVGTGTIASTVGVINAAEGVIRATNGTLFINSTSVSQSGTMIGGTTGTSVIQITNLTQNLVNSGTMILDSPVGGTTNLAFDIRRTGGAGDFTNAAGGVIIGAGFFKTADFVSGGQNFTVWNLGSIIATNGALILQPGDAFANGGFVNLGGTVTVATATSTFGIQRTDTAWDNSGSSPRNEGVILLNGGTLAFYGNSLAVQRNRMITNAATGTITGFGTVNGSIINVGTIVATNGTLFINNSSTTNIIQSGTIAVASGGTLTILGTSGSFQNSGGRMLFGGGTFVATNVTAVRNAGGGIISGFGTIQSGRTSGSGGANAEIINTDGSQIIATNGTLYLNPGDAFNAGGLSNSATSTIRVAPDGSLVLNRTANAWNGSASPRNLGTISLEGGSWSNFSDGVSDSSRYIANIGTLTGRGTFSGSVTNAGTIAATNGTLAIIGSNPFFQSGTLAVETTGTLLLSNATTAALVNFTNSGAILMRGGTLTAGVIANTNVIAGFGTISGGGVDNAGRLLASNGVLVAGVSSFTNIASATLGTATNNATLDLTMPGGAGQPLINLGTVSMRGGTLLFNGTATGTISNRPSGTIIGVGEVTQTVVNNGTIMAANPISGLSLFSVGLSDINVGTIGASNNAILNVVISGGAATTFRNEGSISMIGGSLIISNGNFGIITNAGTISGVGTVTPSIHNLSNILATVSGGTLDVRLLGGTNSASGQMRAGSGATLQVQDSLINFGTLGAVGAAGGTIQMATASGVITNRGVITSDAAAASTLTINNFVVNAADGTIIATNGTVAFNAVNGLASTGVIHVANSGTFQSNSSNSWANAGTIEMRGGTLRTGGFTNVVTAAVWTNTGTVTGYGTILGGGAYGGSGAGFDKSVANLGTIIVTNPLSGAAATLTISTGGATSEDGIRNSGNMIISSNNTLALNRQAGLPILNTGTITIHNGTLTGSGVLSNITGGVIQGFGTLTHDIVNLAGGLIHASNGLMTMTSTVFPVNQGTFMVSAGATMTWNTSNSWRNVGTVDLRGGTLRTGGFTNPAVTAVFTNTGSIKGWGTLFGGGAFNTNGVGIDKSFVNEGIVIASNGVLTIDTGVATTNRGLANLGTMIVQGPTDTLALLRQAEVSGAPFFVTNLNYLYNSGRIFINGGTLTANTSITNQFESASLPGLIEGYGRIALTNEIVNLGTIRATNGVLQFINSQAGDTDIVEIRQSGTLVVESGSEMIVGAASNSVLVNNGTIVMRGGIFRSSNLTNSLGATFRGYGTITSPIINFGTGLATSASVPLHLTSATVENRSSGVLGASNGILIVDAVFTNAGTVTFRNSLGTFNSAVVNQGAWTMNPSTNVYFGDYTVTSNGYLTMASQSVNIFKSNFYNRSYMSNEYDTLAGRFVFNGAGGYTQSFYVAGIDMLGTNGVPIGTPSQTNAFLVLGPQPIIGYSNNFALSSLEVGSLNTTSSLVLVDTRGTLEPDDGRKAGLYVHSFSIAPGSLLIISNNVEFYFMSSNGVSGVSLGTLNPGDNVLILAGGSFHQLNVVPEPSILFLLTVGAAGIVWYRRRRS